MDQAADGPKGDQGPETGHSRFEENIFPVLTEPGSDEGSGEQDK